MERRAINSPATAPTLSRYAHAVEVTGATRQLFISGQIPVDAKGIAPPSFAEQCRLAWANVEAQLVAADMSFDNLVKVTIFLSDRRYAVENRAIRQEILGERTPALTLIICGIFDDSWLLEIEAIAAA